MVPAIEENLLGHRPALLRKARVPDVRGSLWVLFVSHPVGGDFKVRLLQKIQGELALLGPLVAGAWTEPCCEGGKRHQGSLCRLSALPVPSTAQERWADALNCGIRGQLSSIP